MTPSPPSRELGAIAGRGACRAGGCAAVAMGSGRAADVRFDLEDASAWPEHLRDKGEQLSITCGRGGYTAVRFIVPLSAPPARRRVR
jgi:hypothetical protein